MRKIDYIFIDSDRKTNDSKPDSHDVSNLRYHYVVNSQGCVINPTPVQLTTKLIDGPVYDPDKYNKCSIFVRYCGIPMTSWASVPPYSTSSLNYASTSPMPRYLVYQKSMARNFTAATSSLAMP